MSTKTHEEIIEEMMLRNGVDSLPTKVLADYVQDHPHEVAEVLSTLIRSSKDLLPSLLLPLVMEKLSIQTHPQYGVSDGRSSARLIYYDIEILWEGMVLSTARIHMR